MKKSLRAIIVSLALAAHLARAEVQDQPLFYKDGDVTLAGTLALDPTSPAPRPGILIFHQWAGPSEHEMTYADRLAARGYAVLVADVYGEGVRPETTEARTEQVMKYKNNRALMRSRALAALHAIRGQPGVDPERLAALGFCFGGTVALELARAGAPLAGVVSIHGGLDNPHPENDKPVLAKVLVLHGADDPNVPPEQIAAFEKEMRDTKADWQLIAYGGAVHAFTQRDAGDDPSKGVAYNGKAAARSWNHLLTFLQELFP